MEMMKKLMSQMRVKEISSETRVKTPSGDHSIRMTADLSDEYGDGVPLEESFRACLVLGMETQLAVYENATAAGHLTQAEAASKFKEIRTNYGMLLSRVVGG